MGEVVFPADLVVLEMHDFDVILGMDWLAGHHASMDCYRKMITFKLEDLPSEVKFQGEKKFEQKVKAYKNWIYDNRNRPMREIIKELNVKLIGHYRYYGVTWNFRKITTFLHRVQQFLFKAMNRRGCRRAYTWNGFVQMLKYYPLAKPKTYYCLY